MIVMKFGGSSVESAAATERVAGIVKARLDRKPVVVVSAMGKTTNKLLALATLAVRGQREEALTALAGLENFHHAEAPESPDLQTAIHEHFQELTELVRGLAVMGELTPRATDAVSAFGERLSSLIVAEVFRQHGIDCEHLDARRVIITDRRHTQAAPLFDQTYQRLAEIVPPMVEQRAVVMGGFIASTEDGVTSTLGRGGSDYTASIVGAGIGAEEIQIWTDVDGMLTSDPRILPGGHRVKRCSFNEAAELAYFGAKVLHPATVIPAMEKDIPVLILNSRRPDVEGTRIESKPTPCANAVKSIACKRDIVVVNITSTRMLMAHGFLRRIFEIFDRYQIPVDMVTTSEVSVSLTVDNKESLDAICAELHKFAEVDVDESQSIVCLVGENLRHTTGVIARAFGALNGINIRMISQGASKLNLSFAVASDDLLRSVELLHKEFFTELDPAVFD